jgi:hypothetical protein
MRTKSRIRNLINEIESLSDLEVFRPTRERGIVEVRSLLFTVLKKYYRFTLREMIELCAENHFFITHASIIHSLKSFDIYAKYNTNLLQWLHVLALDLEEDAAQERIDFIKPKLKYLSEDNLFKLSTIVKEMYEEDIILLAEKEKEETLQT